MVLTDRQRTDLHSGIYEYLLSRPGDAFARAAAALAEADPSSCVVKENSKPAPASAAPLLERKWTAVPRLQKKVLELERAAAQSARIHAHRAGMSSADAGAGAGPMAGRGRRMIPRPPATHTLRGHQGVVTCVAIHPVYTVAVSGSEDGTVKIWDHESGDYVRTLKGHTNTVHSAAFTPTGTHLATSSSDLSIKLWDFSTYACVRTLRGHDHTISCVRFVPSPAATVSSNLMATLGGSDGGGGAEQPAASSTGVDSAAAGAAQLVSASRDCTVKFWDVETGFCVHTVGDHSDWVRSVAVRDSDGELVATAGNDCVVNVYRSGGARSKICELRGHEHVVESVAFVCAVTPAAAAEAGTANGGGGTGGGAGSDGGGAGGGRPSAAGRKADELNDLVASCGRDRTVRLWSIGQATCLNVFSSHENWARSVLIHPSGNFVLSCGDDRSVRVYDVKSKRCLRTIEDAHPHFVTAIAMHPTLPVMVSGGVDQTVRCWQLD